MSLRGVTCALALMGALGGCGTRSPSGSMRYALHAPLGPTAAPGLVVMLPGFGDRPAHFEEHDFVGLARESGEWDVLLPDAHFGYYRSEQVVSRLRQDIIGPARALGYRRIWLVGVSMGGFGASAYTSLHPNEIEGMILLSPYLGASVAAEHGYESQGSIRDTVRDAVTSDPPTEVEERVWSELRRRAKQKQVNIFLAYGSDEQNGGHALLASLLPKENVLVQPGGHNWKVWGSAFATLAGTALASSASAGE